MELKLSYMDLKVTYMRLKVTYMGFVNFIRECTKATRRILVWRILIFFVHMSSQIHSSKMRQFHMRVSESDPEDFSMKNFIFFVHIYTQIHSSKMRQECRK